MTRPSLPPLPAVCLVAAGSFTVCSTFATDRPSWLNSLSVALGLVLVAVGGYIAGVQRFVSDVSASLSRVPAKVVLHEDDDGGKHALVTLADGDVRSVPIPPEHADTPQEAVAYVVELLAREAFDV